jgi:hypothetical protein
MKKIKLCKSSKREVVFNLYCLDLILHLEGSGIEVPTTVTCVWVLQWGICGLLCGWPIEVVKNV